MKKHNFWNTQPYYKCSKLNENIITQSIDLSLKWLKLPNNFKWSKSNFDLKDTRIYEFLKNNYVESDGFRFHYSKTFLEKIIDICVGILDEDDNLCGFIGCTYKTMHIFTRNIKVAEINFLCVDKKHRNKELAPLLIKQITLIANFNGIYQAIYTGGIKIMEPLCVSRYWHKPLNCEKLIRTKFMNNTCIPIQNKLTLPFRKMITNDIDQIYHLLLEYQKNLNIYIIHTKKDIEQWLLLDEISVYVLEKDNKIIAFCSWYQINILASNGENIKAAYSFYNYGIIKLEKIIINALILANIEKFDIYYSLDISHNKLFIDKLKFIKGNGILNYYIYNWTCPYISNDKINVIIF